MIFPASNLSTAAQPWGRVVEKSIGSLETLVATERVNNAARDAQAVVNIKRLDDSVVSLAAQQIVTAAAAKNAQDAIDALGELDQATSTYKINAANLTVGSLSGDRISGGTITGTVIQSAASGQRVIVNSSNLSFYNSGNSFTGSIYGSDYGGSNSVTMEVSNGSGVVAAYLGGAYLGNNSSAYFQVFSGNSFVNGGEFRSTASSNSFYNATTVRSSLDVWAGLNTDSTLRRSVLAGGTLTGASITADGYFVRTSSSERYKQDIQDLVLNYEDIISLSPKIFRRKDEVETNPNARYYAGFIAEDIAESPLDLFAFYQSEKDGGLPDGVHYSELTAALLLAIKHQDSLIKSLESRLTELEGK